jgi:hypothetical protein
MAITRALRAPIQYRKGFIDGVRRQTGPSATVPSSEPHRFENFTLVSGEVVIPLPLEKDTKLTQINNPELLMNFSVITARHSVEMKFSITANNIHGQT